MLNRKSQFPATIHELRIPTTYLFYDPARCFTTIVSELNVVNTHSNPKRDCHPHGTTLMSSGAQRVNSLCQFCKVELGTYSRVESRQSQLIALYFQTRQLTTTRNGLQFSTLNKMERNDMI